MMMGREEVVKADLIAQTALQHFSSQGSPADLVLLVVCATGFLVIASFVVESEDKKAFYPLCTASGTKCLEAKKSHAEAIPGTVLEDSHGNAQGEPSIGLLLNLIKEERIIIDYPILRGFKRRYHVGNELLIPVENDVKIMWEDHLLHQIPLLLLLLVYRWNQSGSCTFTSVIHPVEMHQSTKRGRWKELGRELNAEPINKSYTRANNMNFNLLPVPNCLSVAKEGHEQR